MLLVVADEAFGFVRVESEEGGRGKWGGGRYHCALHCSLHPPEYCNVDGCTLGWCCGHFSYRLRVRYISQHVFVLDQKFDVYDVPVYGDLYSMDVGKNVCRVVDHYDDV